MTTSTAQIELTAQAWTLIGTGPLNVVLQQDDYGSPVYLREQDQQPAPGDLPHYRLTPLQPFVAIRSGAQVWAYLVDLYQAATLGVTAGIEIPVASVMMTAAAGTATDASESAPSLTGLTPLTTINAGARLGFWFCQNQSASQIMVVLDDGEGGNPSVFLLAANAAADQQGGSMGSADTGPHLGRIRVYGAAGSQFALRAQ